MVENKNSQTRTAAVPLYSAPAKQGYWIFINLWGVAYVLHVAVLANANKTSSKLWC